MRSVQHVKSGFNRALAPRPFKSIGIVSLGDGASLEVQVGMSGGARVINMRNALHSRAGTLPAGPGALVGADRVGDLIALLQRAVALQGVVS
jgi:hypothetical protein